MLSLSDRQTHRIADKVFLDRLVRIVHASEPEAATELGSPAGQQELQRQCAQARRHGLVSEADIGRYVITAWLLGRDFHELPAMRDILSRRDVTAAQKTEALERVTRTVFGILNDGRR